MLNIIGDWPPISSLPENFVQLIPQKGFLSIAVFQKQSEANGCREVLK